MSDMAQVFVVESESFATRSNGLYFIGIPFSINHLFIA